MQFKELSVSDAALFQNFETAGEMSCENNFIALLMWGGLYHNSFAVEDGTLYIKSRFEIGEVFSLPFGDTQGGVERLTEYNGGKPVTFWAQEGARLDRFLNRFGDRYELIDDRDSFDYIYRREALAELSGKKYHGKRNHIAAFSKKYDWHYEPITAENRDKIRLCADEWFSGHEQRDSRHLRAEYEGILLLLSELQRLPVRGGAIFCGERAVAFTIGSPINDRVFNIHIEKALDDYSEAYTVINREFVRRELSGYEFVNREDDMGLEGLRRSKLSYKPEILLKKYICRPR